MRLKDTIKYSGTDRVVIEDYIKRGEYTEEQRHYMMKELAATPLDILEAWLFRKGPDFICRELLKGFHHDSKKRRTVG